MPPIGHMIFMFAFVATLLLAIDWLAYRLLERQSSENPSWVLIKRSWIFLIGVIWIAFVINGFMWPTWRVTHPRLLSVLSISFFVVFVPKLMMAGFEVLEIIRGGTAWGVNQLVQSSSPISRKSFLTQAGMGLSGATFLSFLYGVTWGKYAFRTERISIPIEGLPSGLSGMKIVQISDAHLGSFTNTPKPVLDALEGINKLEPDLILFTGDLVNTHADEAEAWIPAFKSLKARLGKFSIMGNHDYADYGPFEDWEREESRAKLKEIHTQMGFKLMLNEHERIDYNGVALVLLGVENWGSGFRKNGDLIKAMEGSGCHMMPTVLMTHDPTHWEEKVMNGKAPVELTLSGHTHGMQFGIEIPWLGVKWSPSKWRYNRWAGLYKEGGQYLHVNRGFGVLGFHGRVGMPPEITVLELVQA